MKAHPIRVLLIAVALAAVTSTALAAGTTAPPTPAQPSDAGVALVKKAITACLMKDEEAAFRRYLELLHPDRRATDRAVGEVRRYTWKRFRKQCRMFVKGERVETLEVARVAPDPVPADARTFKIFFTPFGVERMPAPVGFRRAGGSWYIDTNSL